MLNFIDYFLDRITMYRLMLYYLIALLGIAFILSFFGKISYSPYAIVFSTLFILFVCYVSNKIYSYVYKSPTNVESVYITALILALILKPSLSLHALPLFGFAAFLAIASKYILAIGKKHVFNPCAIAVIATSIGLTQSANWWVGTAWMAPFVVIGGLLVIKKLQREDMVYAFFTIAIIVSVLFGMSKGTPISQTLIRVMLDSSLFFLGFVMLTEPLTTPSTKNKQIIYGTIVGLLFSPSIHLGSIYSTPEIALVIGNIFSYFVSPKSKLLLNLSEKKQIGEDIVDFIFPLKKRINFNPGQYMEWTLSHKNTDSRGNRRYFTIASSPTEDTIRLGIKFYPNGSSYKRALFNIDNNTQLIASQLSGEFTLPKDQAKKLVFIAGGIGITPYRSIIKYLIDKNEKRDIVLLYSNKKFSEIMYKEIFDKAYQQLGIRSVYTLTSDNPPGWSERLGRIDPQMIREEIPDFMQRIFYLSGPHAMVKGFEQTLKEIGIPKKQIKIDFFPGFV